MKPLKCEAYPSATFTSSPNINTEKKYWADVESERWNEKASEKKGEEKFRHFKQPRGEQGGAKGKGIGVKISDQNCVKCNHTYTLLRTKMQGRQKKEGRERGKL